MQFRRLLKQLRTAEGFRSTPYKDSLGRWTIGFGDTRVNAVKVSASTRPISYTVALELLKSDTFSACIDAQGLFNNFSELDDVRQEVLVNMAFNLGASGLARFVKMHAAILDKDFDRAAKEMKDSRWYNQVGHRAKRLVKRMITGETA